MQSVRNAVRVSLGAALVASLALVPAVQAQQENSISGRVLDATDNAPIPTAQVVVTGTTVGQTTTDSGRFTLRVPSDAKSLTVRRIGYLAQTVPISPGQAEYRILLQKDVLRLEAQVVTGIATTVSSQNAANAVSAVTAQEVAQVPSPTVENALEGKVPGAIIENNNGGQPGGSVQVQVRGITSIFGNAEPLYVVDGVIYNNSVVNSGINAITQAGGGQNGVGKAAAGAPSEEDSGINRAADLNPDDIESVEVLKGASAAAIYGSKGSAGVVVITTKKGTAGKARWDINGQLGQYTDMKQYPYRTFPTLASAQSWYLNDEHPSDIGNAGKVAADNAFISGIYAGPENYQNQLFGNSQASYSTNVSVSGTASNTSYFLSGLTKYDNGIMLNTGYNKQSVRTNVTQQFASALSVTANLNYVHDVTRDGITGNDNVGISPYDVFSQTPQFQMQNHLTPAGTWPINHFAPANVIADALDIDTPQAASRFVGGGTALWTPWKTEHQSLQVNVTGGADLTSLNTQVYAPPTLQVEQAVASANPGVSESNLSQTNYLNYQINLTHHWTGLSWLDATTSAGYLREKNDYTNPVTIGYNLLNAVNAPTVGTQTVSYYYRTAERDQTLYGQEQLITLDSRLTVTGGVTAERSTLDGNIGQFYAYPRYNASYRIPQFVGFLNDLKVRAAYGQSGNLPPYGSKYTPSIPQEIDGSTEGILNNNQLGSPIMKPETEQETELGFDATMLGSRAQFSFTVYSKVLTNLLLQAGVSPSHGYSILYENGGQFTNQGIELSLTMTPVQLRNGFSWNSTTTYFRNYSVVNALPTPAFIAGPNFGYGSDLLTQGRSATEIVNPNDVLGNGVPIQNGDFSAAYVMSFNNELSWNAFRLTGMFEWSRGGNTINLTDQYFDVGPYLGTDSVTAVKNTQLFGTNMYEPYVQSAAFLKLRELTFSYNLPAALIGSFAGGRISSARVSLSGYNLFGWYSYRGLDPEVSAFGNQPIGRGYDVTPYPPARAFYVGLDLGL